MRLRDRQTTWLLLASDRRPSRHRVRRLKAARHARGRQYTRPRHRQPRAVSHRDAHARTL